MIQLTPSRLAGGTTAFVVATFAVQALSHFVIAADHFAAVAFLRPEPVIAAGVGTMVVQGLVLSSVFSRFARRDTLTRDAFVFALAMGTFLGLYVAVVEPSKYLVPSVAGWVGVEGLAALVQFVLFGAGLRVAFAR